MKGPKYAKIRPVIWKGKSFSCLSRHGKLLLMYFLTSPRFHMLGIYEAPRAFILKETGLNKNELEISLGELIENKFICYEDEAGVVWVCSMALSQVSDGNTSPQQRKGVINELTRLFNDDFPFVQEFLDKYREKYDFLPESQIDLEWNQER